MPKRKYKPYGSPRAQFRKDAETQRNLDMVRNWLTCTTGEEPSETEVIRAALRLAAISVQKPNSEKVAKNF